MSQSFKNPIEQSNALVNSHKRFEFSDDELENIKNYAKRNFLMDDYELEDIDIDQVAQDNDLDNDTSMANRRVQWWGDDINKYSINPDSFKRTMISDPIRIKPSEDGKLRIADGHHRLKALKNMGYTQVPAFVKKRG